MGRLDVGCLAGGLLGDRPALVAGAVEGVHHCRPIRFAIEQFRVLASGTRNRRFSVEILDVYSHDAFAEHLNPSLSRTLSSANIADVKMPADPLAIDRVEVSHRLFR